MIKSDSIDSNFMRKAFIQAQKAYSVNEIPIGAIVVSPDGKVLSSAYNLVEKKKSQLAHAEILAIEKAAKKLKTWHLNGCTMYVTLEPCSLCMNLILRSNISILNYSLPSKLYGFSLDKYNTFELYKVPITIKQGLYKNDSLNLLQTFFKNRRKGHNGEK